MDEEEEEELTPSHGVALGFPIPLPQLLAVVTKLQTLNRNLLYGRSRKNPAIRTHLQVGKRTPLRCRGLGSYITKRPKSKKYIPSDIHAKILSLILFFEKW